MSATSRIIGTGSLPGVFCNQNSSLGSFLLPSSSSSSLVTSRENGSIQSAINTTHLPIKTAFLKATGDGGGSSISSASKEYDDNDGVSLGTMKLPSDTDLVRFETLLFQWANSLCQGANLPMPMPLKVDKIRGGARIGFITIGDGETEVEVYIDCLVFPSSSDGSSSGPVFRAIRNGSKKDGAPPGEPRIMRSLLAALKKSVEIARV